MREYRARISRSTPPLTNLAALHIRTVLVAAINYHLLDHSVPEGRHGERSTRLSRSVGESYE